MRYYKRTSGIYILAVGTGIGGTEITEEEYNRIFAAIKTKPETTETTDYMLRDDLIWEAYVVEPISEQISTT